MKKLMVIFFLAALVNGCSMPEDNTPTTVPWVDNVMVQPVPAWGSALRLSLPVPVDSIVLGPSGGIGGFGSHQGGHVEGLDHVWIEASGAPTIKSWGSGKVTSVEDMGGEYFITIDYGQGLIGKHMAVETPLVNVGDNVTEGVTDVAIGHLSGTMRDAEFMLADLNRRDGVRYGKGSFVSPFDYLKADVQTALVNRMKNEVMNVYFKDGLVAGNNKPWEPWLTNKVLFHGEHPGTVVGDWILANKGWRTPDPLYFDVMTVFDVTDGYGHHFLRYEIMDDDSTRSGYKQGDSGDWSLPGLGKITFVGGGKTYYGLYRVDEDGTRARLTLEWSESGYPSALTAAAAVYLQRANLHRRGDAQQLGLL